MNRNDWTCFFKKLKRVSHIRTNKEQSFTLSANRFFVIVSLNLPACAPMSERVEIQRKKFALTKLFQSSRPWSRRRKHDANIGRKSSEWKRALESNLSEIRNLPMKRPVYGTKLFASWACISIFCLKLVLPCKSKPEHITSTNKSRRFWRS